MKNNNCVVAKLQNQKKTSFKTIVVYIDYDFFGGLYDAQNELRGTKFYSKVFFPLKKYNGFLAPRKIYEKIISMINCDYYFITEDWEYDIAKQYAEKVYTDPEFANSKIGVVYKKDTLIIMLFEPGKSDTEDYLYSAEIPCQEITKYMEDKGDVWASFLDHKEK